MSGWISCVSSEKLVIQGKKKTLMNFFFFFIILGNEIGSNGARELAEALKLNKTLTNLDLDSKFREECIYKTTAK